MAEPISLFPWQQADWQRIAGAWHNLHHGLMLSGQGGIGKREFATLLSQKLLCDRPADQPCGDCQSCRLFVAATHPDIHVVATEREAVEGRIKLVKAYANRYQDTVARDKKTNLGMLITVDQIRLLIDRFYQASHIASRRVALIIGADRMNSNAANALLKLLEEPPDNAHFILVSTDPGMLPSTIRSRCLIEPLAAPAPAEALQWLQRQPEAEGDAESHRILGASRLGPLDLLQNMASGAMAVQKDNQKALLALLAGRIDPVEAAAIMSKQDIAELLLWMHQFCADLIRRGVAGQQSSGEPAQPLPDNLDSARLHAVYDKISYYRRLAREQLNGQLALEELLIGFRQAA